MVDYFRQLVIISSECSIHQCLVTSYCDVIDVGALPESLEELDRPEDLVTIAQDIGMEEHELGFVHLGKPVLVEKVRNGLFCRVVQGQSTTIQRDRPRNS